MSEVILAKCACGGDSHASDYVGGFRDKPARVTCYRCGVSVDAGERRGIAFALQRWDALQEVLRAGQWKEAW